MNAKARANRAPVVVAAAQKPAPRKFVDYTVFARIGREEKPIGTVSDFGLCDGLKSACMRECQQSGAVLSGFRIVERNFDESRSDALQETEVK